MASADLFKDMFFDECKLHSICTQCKTQLRKPNKTLTRTHVEDPLVETKVGVAGKGTQQLLSGQAALQKTSLVGIHIASVGLPFLLLGWCQPPQNRGDCIQMDPQRFSDVMILP